MTKAELTQLNASFETIENFGSTGFSEYAVKPFGGAYKLINGSFERMGGTSTIYDITELRSLLFGIAKDDKAFSVALDSFEALHP